MTETQAQATASGGELQAKVSQKGKKKAKPKRTDRDVLALCAQAISDATEELEFVYTMIAGECPASPKTIGGVKKIVNDSLRPKLTNFMMIKKQLMDGRKDIRIGKRCLDGVDWQLDTVKEYLSFLKSATDSNVGIEHAEVFVDSVYGTIDYRIDQLNDALETLKELFGGEGWGE
jgi:hypothetical protein